MKIRKHFLDSDATCIHCGVDACDVPEGVSLPECVDVDAKLHAMREAAQLSDDLGVQVLSGEWK